MGFYRPLVNQSEKRILKSHVINIGYHMRGKAISVLSHEERYHKRQELTQRTRNISDIVLKAIKLISPHPDYDNVFFTYILVP